MKKTYDHYLLELVDEKITWWEYAVAVPSKHRPREYLNYWSYLKNKNLSKRIVKKAEWRVEGAKKGVQVNF